MMYESRLYAFMDQSTFSGIIWRIVWGISVALSSFRDVLGGDWFFARDLAKQGLHIDCQGSILIDAYPGDPSQRGLRHWVAATGNASGESTSGADSPWHGWKSHGRMVSSLRCQVSSQIVMSFPCFFQVRPRGHVKNHQILPFFCAQTSGWNHLKTLLKCCTGSRAHRSRWFRHKAKPLRHMGNLAGEVEPPCIRSSMKNCMKSPTIRVLETRVGI